MPYTSSSPASSTATLFTTYAAEKTVLTPQGKDYAAAFGNLQTQLGLSGSTPAPAAGTAPRPANGSKRAWWKPQREPSDRARQPERHASAPAPAPTKSTGGKDFEAAFGQLQSSYGLGGGVPVRKDKSRLQSVQWNT